MEKKIDEISLLPIKIKGDLLQLELDLKKQFDTSNLAADLNELKAWRISYLKDFDDLDKDVDKIRTSQDDSIKKLKQVSSQVTELVGWRANILKQELDKLRKDLDSGVTAFKTESETSNEMAKKTSVSVEALESWKKTSTEELAEMEKSLKKVSDDIKSLKDDSSSAKIREDIEEFKGKVQTRLKTLKTEMEAMETRTNKIGSAVKKLQKKDEDDF